MAIVEMAQRARSYSDFEAIRAVSGAAEGHTMETIAETLQTGSESEYDGAQFTAAPSGGSAESRHARSAPSSPETEKRVLSFLVRSTLQLNSSPDMMTNGTLARRSESISPHASLRMSPHKIKKNRNEKFHRVFKTIPLDERVIKCCSCAFFGDILLQGYLYITPNWFCFYTKILGHQKQIEIAVADVLNITRQKTVFIIPNAIGIVTADDKYVFGSLLSRDSTFKLMYSCWKKTFLQTEDERSTEVGLNESDNVDSSVEASRRRKPTIEVTRLSGGDAASSADEEDEEEEEESGGTDGSPSSPPRSPPAGGDEGGRLAPPQQPDAPAAAAPRPRIGCIGYKWVQEAVHRIASNLQSMPWTHLLLIICMFLTIFLLVCACVLTLKIVVLQERMEQRSGWSELEAGEATQMRQTYQGMYHLNDRYHSTSIDKLHAMLQANVQILNGVQHSLLKLRLRVPRHEHCDETTSSASSASSASSTSSASSASSASSRSSAPSASSDVHDAT